jgi:hypothetical protein
MRNYSIAFPLMYVGIIREKRLKAVIIGGSAHFHSRGNISKALANGEFDMIFQGGTELFLNSAKSYLQIRR